jgi:hypothetical protein
MNCTIHVDKEASGACVYCGKLFCSDCLIDIDGKNYCKSCVNRVFDDKDRELDKMENRSNNNSGPVYMNSGGGAVSSHAVVGSGNLGYGNRYMRPPYPVNSPVAHAFLFLFTAGIGNLIYYIHIRQKQQQWHMLNDDMMYGDMMNGDGVYDDRMR